MDQPSKSVSHNQYSDIDSPGDRHFRLAIMQHLPTTSMRPMGYMSILSTRATTSAKATSATTTPILDSRVNQRVKIGDFWRKRGDITVLFEHGDLCCAFVYNSTAIIYKHAITKGDFQTHEPCVNHTELLHTMTYRTTRVLCGDDEIPGKDTLKQCDSRQDIECAIQRLIEMNELENESEINMAARNHKEHTEKHFTVILPNPHVEVITKLKKRIEMGNFEERAE